MKFLMKFILRGTILVFTAYTLASIATEPDVDSSPGLAVREAVPYRAQVAVQKLMMHYIMTNNNTIDIEGNTAIFNSLQDSVFKEGASFFSIAEYMTGKDSYKVKLCVTKSGPYILLDRVVLLEKNGEEVNTLLWENVKGKQRAQSRQKQVANAAQRRSFDFKSALDEEALVKAKTASFEREKGTQNTRSLRDGNLDPRLNNDPFGFGLIKKIVSERPVKNAVQQGSDTAEREVIVQPVPQHIRTAAASREREVVITPVSKIKSSSSRTERDVIITPVRN